VKPDAHSSEALESLPRIDAKPTPDLGVNLSAVRGKIFQMSDEPQPKLREI
jgi:hypothetical protein